MGEVLKEYRTEKKMTLRQVATRGCLALGYLSELERGQKEASSEILLSIAEALDVPLSEIIMKVADRLALFEPAIPDTIPDDFYFDRESQ